MKKKIFIICSVLAAVLCFGLLLNILTPKVKLPDKVVYRNMDIADNVLVSYDNIELNFKSNRVAFDFEDIPLDSYDFLVLDVNISNKANDFYTQSIDLLLSNVDADLICSFNLGYLGDSTEVGIVDCPLFPSLVGVLHNEFKDYIFTYVIDCRETSNNKITLMTYLNGSFQVKKEFGIIENCSSELMSFEFNYNSSAELQDISSFKDFFIYAFNGDTAFIDAISDTSINLKDCPDSMLYEGN